MFVKVLRQRFRLSQEQLAESSGLSLRTIQRVEAGHRVGDKYSAWPLLGHTQPCEIPGTAKKN